MLRFIHESFTHCVFLSRISLPYLCFSSFLCPPPPHLFRSNFSFQHLQIMSGSSCSPASQRSKHTRRCPSLDFSSFTTRSRASPSIQTRWTPSSAFRTQHPVSTKPASTGVCVCGCVCVCVDVCVWMVGQHDHFVCRLTLVCVLLTPPPLMCGVVRCCCCAFLLCVLSWSSLSLSRPLCVLACAASPISSSGSAISLLTRMR